MSAEVFYQETSLNKDRLTELVGLFQEIPERKRELDLTMTETPSVARSLGRVLAPVLGREPNTAIFKRYDNRGGYISGAYSPHPEPERFAEDRTAMISVTGLAYAFTVVGGRIRTAKCQSSSILFRDANLVHWVTPPLLQNIRLAVFYGFDRTKAG